MKIYLAGPDVFRPDALVWAETARTLCRERGLTPLLPIDGAETTAEGIYHHNRRLIAEADAVVANLNPFRGHEPDSGTCVEVGVALALGKPVFGYIRDGRPLTERVPGKLEKDGLRDADGMLVEDFNLPVNLMIAVPARIIIGELAETLDALLMELPEASPRD